MNDIDFKRAKELKDEAIASLGKLAYMYRVETDKIDEDDKKLLSDFTDEEIEETFEYTDAELQDLYEKRLLIEVEDTLEETIENLSCDVYIAGEYDSKAINKKGDDTIVTQEAIN